MNTRAKAGRGRRAPVRHLANERGSVLVLVVLLLIVFLGLCALAIDLGMLHVARGEAQRAADAAAHGGAVHLFQNPGSSEQEVKEAAIRAGTLNGIRGSAGSIILDDVQILWAQDRVTAWVHRTRERENPVRTIFGGVLGFPHRDVAAYAAAEIVTATHSKCVLPIAIPDRWCENWDSISESCIGPTWPDQMDTYDYPDDNDYYKAWSPGSTNYTGYGEDSLGDTLYLRPEAPGGGQGQGQGSGGTRWNPGWWNPFYIPGAWGPNPPDLGAMIIGCTDNLVGVGDSIVSAGGNMPNLAGDWSALIAQDSEAEWDEALLCVTSGDGVCRNSPRLRPIALFNPTQGPGGMGPNNAFGISTLAGVFVDEVMGGPPGQGGGGGGGGGGQGGGQGGGGNMQVRVIFVKITATIPGDGDNQGGGLLTKMIRIVE